MNAVEFVKKYGWEEAKRFANMLGSSEVEGVSAKDLKRLVESYELVESYGGLDKSKFYVDLLPFTPAGISRSTLKQAIADVEKCQ